MRQFVNTSLVRRNDYLGRGMIILGLVLVLGGFLYSFKDPAAFLQLSIVLIVGIIISQAGLMIFMRWGSKPRDHEILGSELRGFSDHHLLIHFALNARHMFLCTGGAFNLIPVRHEGDVLSQDGAMVVRTPVQGLLKRSRTIRLSRLQRLAIKEASRVAQSVAEVTGFTEPLPVESVFVFLGNEVTISESLKTAGVVHLKQLKSELRKACKSKNVISTDDLDAIVDHII